MVRPPSARSRVLSGAVGGSALDLLAERLGSVFPRHHGHLGSTWNPGPGRRRRTIRFVDVSRDRGRSAVPREPRLDAAPTLLTPFHVERFVRVVDPAADDDRGWARRRPVGRAVPPPPGHLRGLRRGATPRETPSGIIPLAAPRRAGDPLGGPSDDHRGPRPTLPAPLGHGGAPGATRLRRHHGPGAG